MTTTLTRSPRSVIPQRTNLLRNPKGVTTMDWSVAAAAGAPTITAAFDAAVNPSGGQSLIRCTLATATASLTIAIAHSNIYPLTPGTTYTASGYAYLTGLLTARVQPVISWVGQNGLEISTSLGAVSSVGASYTRYSISGVAPAGTVRATVRFVFTPPSGTLSVGFTMGVTGAMLETSAVLGSYFDGDTATAGATQNRWVGQANFSLSVQGPLNPGDIVHPLQTNGYHMPRPASNTIVDVPGRPDPIVNPRPAKLRRGTLEFLLGTDTALVAAFDALMDDAAAFVFTDTDRALVGMTFALDASGYTINLDDDTRDVWLATVNVVEVTP